MSSPSPEPLFKCDVSGAHLPDPLTEFFQSNGSSVDSFFYSLGNCKEEAPYDVTHGMVVNAVMASASTSHCGPGIDRLRAGVTRQRMSLDSATAPSKAPPGHIYP